MTNKAKWRQAFEERNKALNLLSEVLSYVAQGILVPKTLIEDCERLRRNADLKPAPDSP